MADFIQKMQDKLDKTTDEHSRKIIQHNINVVAFHPYCSVGNSWAKNNMMSVIQLKLQKTGKLVLCDRNLIDPVEEPCYEALGFSKEFIGEINFLLKKYGQVIIPTPLSKHNLDEKTPDNNVYIVNHIYKELNSNIGLFIREKLFMKGLETPTCISPLPNREICKEYLTLQSSEISEGKDKKGTYSKVTKEVAARNGYKYNKIVSNKNRSANHKREIYDFNKAIYLSTDFESGCFEVYDAHGKHLGEYSYVNKQISRSDKSGKHNIEL